MVRSLLCPSDSRLRSVLCSVPFTLCPLPFTLCPVPCALSPVLTSGVCRQNRLSLPVSEAI